MNLIDRLRNWINPPDDWTHAEGVLPVERALADEYEAMHAEQMHEALDAVTVEFDASQFVDVEAIAHHLRDAWDIGYVQLKPGGVPPLGFTGVKSPEQFEALRVFDEQVHAARGARNENEDSRISQQRYIAGTLTPRDNVCLSLLWRSEDIKNALVAFEAARESGRAPVELALAAALASTFNELLGEPLVDAPLFQPFLEAGAVQALGDAIMDETPALFMRRANRALLEAVFPDEIFLIRDRRLKVVFDAGRKRDTAALCLSGGGIRSSTFALGIIQGLARHRLLGKFDYLSTVSGGGLSGGWLSAWMRRDGARAVNEALRTPGREKLQPEPEPVQGLRAYSHWLTPSAGSMSIDSWTLIATVIRNLLLNWLVLLPLLAAAVMVPRLMLSILALDAKPPDHATFWVCADLAAGILLMFASSQFLEWVRTSTSDFASGRKDSPTPAQFLLRFLAPRVFGSIIIAFAFYHEDAWRSQPTAEGMDDAFNSTLWLMTGAAVFIVFMMGFRHRGKQSVRQALERSVKVLICGMLGYVVPVLILNAWRRDLYVTFAPAILLLASVAANQLYTGLTSDEASDAEREWAARANAWVLVVAVIWMGSSALVLFGPTLLAGLWQKLTLVGIGGVSSWFTIFLSKKPQTKPGAAPSTGEKLQSVALSLAAPAVCACIVIGLAAANNGTINVMCNQPWFAQQLQCGAPEVEDSTSITLLEIVGRQKRHEVIDSAQKFARDLRRTPAHVARNAAELAAAGRLDSVLTERSRVLSGLTMQWDSIARRGIYRAAVSNWADYPTVRDSAINSLRAAMDSMSDYHTDVYQEFRAMTRRRDYTLTNAVKPMVLTPSEKRFVIERAYSELATDTSLKSGIVQRAAAFDSIGTLLDSVANSQVANPPGDQAVWRGVAALMALMLFGGLFFSNYVNTNTFSLHAMWKVRTVRAFLGTTRAAADRNPNPFTGFDVDDNLSLRTLWPARWSTAEADSEGQRSEALPPMHVLNVTLNLAAGRNLAWQQRKGESMTLSPLHGGSAFTGYRRMGLREQPSRRSTDNAPGYGGPRGVSLGTAMAVSGAAASPSDGSNTTTLSSFLMTFFNARLGWWLGNPGAAGANTWQNSAPLWRLTPILSEMFGLTSDKSAYVYLSDGGHFENLAMYEMVFRRNRFIVVSDAGADPDYTFEDLGNAVRKIRTDFGIPIDFETPVNIKSGDSSFGAYWATARIRYSCIDMPAGGNPDDYDGVLVYIKPAVYGKFEPRDVANYASLSPTFPQESSADQFFSESQFESYRQLGSWIVDQLVANPAAGGAPVKVTAHREGSLLSDWPKLGG